jgi:hypothetical protein
MEDKLHEFILIPYLKIATLADISLVDEFLNAGPSQFHIAAVHDEI